MREAVYTKQDLLTMQAWPLERKIRESQTKIREWYEHYGGKVFVSFSGGKDSTLLLDLVRGLYPDVPAAYADTGMEYPEIQDFVRSIPNVVWLQPIMPFTQIIEQYGYPVIGKEVRQIDGGQAGRVQAVVLTPLRAAHSSLSGINRTISTAEGAAHRLDRAAEQGRGKRERPSVRRQLAQKKAAIPASPGPGLLRKTREAER